MATSPTAGPGSRRILAKRGGLFLVPRGHPRHDRPCKVMHLLRAVRRRDDGARHQVFGELAQIRLNHGLQKHGTGRASWSSQPNGRVVRLDQVVTCRAFVLGDLHGAPLVTVAIRREHFASAPLPSADAHLRHYPSGRRRSGGCSPEPVVVPPWRVIAWEDHLHRLSMASGHLPWEDREQVLGR